ncbi:hypothetical protein THRCLA_04859 [Thraustotheca clavata]|uniref:Uncharacterized protein n=1 Tax=Thraustotheca clavata TaxID=74557 RepID=A0A1V9ZYE2_9STRA|nr:hypothetical protein THRCLA_04859 [Thraustotheca clavata]
MKKLEAKSIFQEDAKTKKMEGDIHARHGDYEKAIVCYNKACFVNPDDYTIYAVRGSAFANLCDFKSAITNFKKVLSIQNNPPQAIKEEIAAVFNAHGYSFLIEKEYTTAIVYLTDAVTLDALQANYWLHRCLAYLGLRNWTKALKDIDHAVCIDANDADILVLRAKLHWKLGLIDKGNADISRAFKLCPNHPEVLDFERKMWFQSQHLHDMACRYIMSREFDKSLECLDSCINFNAQDPKVLILRASVFRELGKYDEAMADVENASSAFFRKQLEEPDQLDEHMQIVSNVEEHPEITRQRNLVLNDMAIAYVKLGHYDAALTAMNKAIASEMATSSRFDGKVIDYRFYINRGDCYRALSKFQPALADYNTALELQPLDKDIHTRIAMIRYHFGIELFNRAAFDKAEIEFTMAIRHNDTIPDFYVRRGDCFRYMEQSELAFQDYKIAQKINPNDTEVKAKIMQYRAICTPGPPPVVSNQERPHRKPTSVEVAWKSAVVKNKAFASLLEHRPDLSSPSKGRIGPLQRKTFQDYY